jgi:hypothetical protein
MLKFLLSQFVKKKGRTPNAIEMLQLKFKASQQVGKGEVVPFPRERITDWTKARPQPPEIEIIDGVQTTRGLGDLFERQMKNIGKKDPALYEDRGGNIIPTQFSEAPAFPSYTAKETDAQILKRLKKQNKDSINRLKNKKDPEDPQKFYQGGQAQIEPDLSGIGHGSDALMARNMLIAPGSQATTSTGLNYLLGEDNDTTRVPYNEGLKVEGPDPRILELMLNEKMSYEDALKEFENRMKQQPYIDERFNMGPGPILEAAEGGRIGYKEAGPVILPKPKPKPNADPLVELQRIYDLYQESMPGVSQETQKYLQQDFIQKLNDAGISQEQFMTNQMQNNFAQGGPARQNFAMGKRAFLKLMGGVGAGIAGLKTGLLGLTKGGGKKVATEAVKEAATGGPPPHFFKLVAKIKALGDDVTETAALADRQTVKKYKDFELTEDLTTGRQEIQRYKVLDDGQGQADYYGNPLTEETYMSYTPGEEIFQETAKGKTKIIKTQPDYQEGTAYIRSDREYAGDVVDEMSGIADDIYEEVGEAIPEAIRKGKADGGRIGYGKGDIVTKGIPALLDLVKNKFGKKAITTADKIKTPQKTLDREMFSKFKDRNPDPKRQITDDEFQDLMEDVGDLDAYNFDGTIGSANKIRKEAKDYQDYMYKQYKMGKLDPVAGDKSPGRKKFLQQKFDEMEGSGDKRLMTRDEIEELSTFDLGTEMDNFGLSSAEKKGKKLADSMSDAEIDLRDEFPGIEDRLIKQILTDDNPQRVAEVKQTMREALEMQNKGMSVDEIIQTFKGTTRTKQAEGGRMGLWLGGGLTAGKGLTREMLKFMSKGSTNAKSPKELLKLYNPKQFNRLLNNPLNTGKISPATGETADEMILDMINKTKEDRAGMVGDLIGSARKIKKVDDDIIAYKNKIIKDMIEGGIDKETANSFANKIATDMKEEAAPQLTSYIPKITDQGLIELENIQKNLITKDRQLQATGGLASILGE